MSLLAKARASILILLLACRPPAVARLVIAIVINAIDRVLRGRSWAHIFQKRFVTVGPFSADRDATPTVILITGAIFPVTAMLHIHPSGVLRRDVMHICCCAVDDGPVDRHFSTQASATLRPAIFEILRSYLRALTAVAYDSPCGLTRPTWLNEIWRTPNNNETSETLVGQVNDCGHGGIVHA